MADLSDVLGKIKAHVGNDFDQMSVFDDLEMICDMTDDTLVASSATRLGIDDSDCDALQMFALSAEDAASELLELLKGATPAAKKAAKGRPKKTDAPAPPEGENVPGDLGQVLAALKANGVADTAMAERLGVSRSTYTNYCKGKTVFAPDDEQVATVRGEVILRANELLAALAVIDGTEQMAVS